MTARKSSPSTQCYAVSFRIRNVVPSTGARMEMVSPLHHFQALKISPKFDLRSTSCERPCCRMEIRFGARQNPQRCAWGAGMMRTRKASQIHPRSQVPNVHDQLRTYTPSACPRISLFQQIGDAFALESERASC